MPEVAEHPRGGAKLAQVQVHRLPAAVLGRLFRCSLFAGVTPLAACAAAPDGSDAEVTWQNEAQAQQSASSAVEIGQTDPRVRGVPVPEFTDRAGRWVLVGEARVAKSATPVPDHAQAAEGSTVDVAEMSATEIAERFRPIMEHQGYEYTLDEASVRALAERMYRSARAAADEVVEGSGPEAATGQLSAAQPPARDAHSVIGTDTRVNYSSYADDYPFNLTAVLYRAAEEWPEGTGFKLINHHTMVTAAHNLHSTTWWYPAQDIQFSAGSQYPRGVIPGWCPARVIPSCYVGTWTVRSSNSASAGGLLPL
jgi:V8-like Glu-specific endopeptidase